MAAGDAFYDQKRKTKNEKRLLMIYGIGVDLVKGARIERVLARYGDRFCAHVFTDREIAYCRDKPWAAAGFAMRFAAKEAFSKALGVGLRKGGIRWREVGVIPNPMGKPEIFVSGRAAQLCAETGITGTHLSLTDEDGRALAVVRPASTDEVAAYVERLMAVFMAEVKGKLSPWK